MSYDDLVYPMGYSAVFFSTLVVVVCIYLLLYLMAATANAVLDVGDAIIPCSEVIKNVQPTAWYAIPVAVISSLYRISQDEVMSEYTRDIDARTWIVRHSFPPNRLTKLFLSKFSSRFLSNGYDINPTVTTTALTVRATSERQNNCVVFVSVISAVHLIFCPTLLCKILEQRTGQNDMRHAAVARAAAFEAVRAVEKSIEVGVGPKQPTAAKNAAWKGPSCQTCTDGTVPDASKRRCRCPTGSVIRNITPSTIVCQVCPQGFYSSPSGLECIICPSPPCCPGGSIYISHHGGESLTESITKAQNDTDSSSQCKKCGKGTMPNREENACELCGTLECYCKMNRSLCASAAVTPVITTTIHLSSGTVVRSALLDEILEGVSSRCSVGSEQDCQTLANLCVLQNYDTSAGTACDIIEKLRHQRAENVLPLLFFSNDADTELYRETAIPQLFMFDSGFAGHLHIILFRYALNGSFLGITRAEKVLQPCAAMETSYLFEFGRRYNLDCSMATDRVVFDKDASFFEAYLKFFDEKGMAQRSRDGLIFPPYLWIEYSEVNTSQSDAVPTKLSVTYEIDPSRHDRELEISMAVLGPLSVLWAAMKAYSWGRRSGKASLLDASTVLQFLLYECAALGEVFFVVITAMSCWITFAYKSQKYPFYSTLNENQEWVLMAYLVTTLCLKLIALVHTILEMVLQETFFIDWERPRVVEDTQQHRPISRDVSKDRMELPVVVWRTYLVANEWAELRCVRATSVGLQLVLVMVLLETFNFIRFSIVQPGFGDGSASTDSTFMTRFAVVVSCYLFVGFLQWVVQVVVVERMILDPFHNFIDLCSIANISVLSLTHPLHGHYIHGRSVHGRADTNMAEMNEFLKKERDDLCGFRGLEPTSHLQTFTVCLPSGFRKRYDEIMNTAKNSTAQTRLSGLDQTTAKMTATVRAHQQMNIFLQEMIDHSSNDVDYIIRDRSFAEAILDAELTDTSQNGNFLS
ncbi:hypothetical protein RB195_015210 [Necator americanus]|uniref:GCC2 and GCC3 n=1 Tax=Necator americanus TaxID=51031 RepID=A0ABR1E3G3_NECAM